MVTKRTKPKRAPVHQEVPEVDCPDPEHVLLDGPTGVPLKVLSLNLGISGLKGSLDHLAATAPRQKTKVRHHERLYVSV